MVDYEIVIPEIGTAQVTKKRGLKSLRLRISPKGEILVSTPLGIPKSVVAKFINDRKDWMKANLPKNQQIILSGGYFAGNIKLLIKEGSSQKNRSVLLSNTLAISLSGKFDPTNIPQQNYIEKKILASMTTLAERQLLPRLEELANNTGHTFNQAYVKPLISRWGSCDNYKNIILNTYLMQVPTILADYVIYHELTHTVHLHHGKEFWAHMANLQPSYKLYRSMLKKYQTAIVMTENPNVQ